MISSSQQCYAGKIEVSHRSCDVEKRCSLMKMVMMVQSVWYGVTLSHMRPSSSHRTGPRLRDVQSVYDKGDQGGSKQPIRTRSLGHVTGYQPIRDQYVLIRSVPGINYIVN
eukprot:sb/3477181/